MNPFRILYINATIDPLASQVLYEGLVEGLKSSKLESRRGIEVVSYDMFHGRKHRPLHMGRFARELSADAVVLSGSDKNTTDREDPWIQEYYRGLRDLLEVPENIEDWSGTSFAVLGICFGHQALACALGGDTSRFSIRNDRVSVQALPGAYRHPMLKSLMDAQPKRALDVVVSHGDQVVRMPSDFYPLFSSDYCDVQGMAHNQWPILSLQSHPEMNKKYLDVPGERAQWPADLDPQTLDAQAGPEILARFADWAATVR